MAPAYDYCCSKCDLTFEVCHPMVETPIVICPKCKSKSTHKVPSLIGLNLRSGRKISMDRAHDQVKKNIEMQQELKQMGIEKVSPLGNSTMTDIYRDVQMQKSQIKETMAFQAAERDKATKNKQKEWTKKALLRTPRRAKEKQEKRAGEAAKKRAIRL
jgi:putative FmdB family regulatory protein